MAKRLEPIVSYLRRTVAGRVPTYPPKGRPPVVPLWEPSHGIGSQHLAGSVPGIQSCPAPARAPAVRPRSSSYRGFGAALGSCRLDSHSGERSDRWLKLPTNPESISASPPWAEA